MEKDVKVALIIGAGPGGLTAAYELLTRTGIRPVILEKSQEMGGISRTVNYKGNRIDIGGHRFFSKSERVLDWWKIFMPEAGGDFDKGEDDDLVMLKRSRVSRILYQRKFFDYPIRLNFLTLINLGLVRVLRIGISYARARMFPLKKERNLEDFFINRFGRELYGTFFKDYTEKVWGIPCNRIKAEWGAQRIKGLSVSKAISHAMKSFFYKGRMATDKDVETSLIDSFLYPKYGPGQLWEEVSAQVQKLGGTVITGADVIKVEWLSNDVVEVTVMDQDCGKMTVYRGGYLFSTMPVRELVAKMGTAIPADIKRIAGGLAYRDFITVGLLLKKLKLKNTVGSDNNKGIISDNWIYIQENDVKLGRLQIFNNWSPYLVADQENVWLGLEYFCDEGDDLWNMPDLQLKEFAVSELVKIGVIYEDDLIDGTVIRVPKAYPAYFGTYDEIDKIRVFADSYPGMFLIGRNGMHKYNNQDHSMLTAMVSVDCILDKSIDKSIVWDVNTEAVYHESANKN